MLIELTPIGMLFGAAIVATLVLNPKQLIWILSVAVPFSHTAMFVVGENGVSPFWATAVVAVGRLFYLLLHRAGGNGPRRARRAGQVELSGATVAILAFAAYGLFITIVGPALFAGTPVITPRGGLDSQIGNFTALTYTSSNFAQAAYLLVGVGLVAYIILERPPSRRILEAAIVTGIALTLFKHFFLQYWPQAWFDSNPSYYYHWIFDGARERGPFAEPSLLGMFIGMSIAYLVSSSVASSWGRRVFYGVLLVAAIYIYAESYTGTALLSLGSTMLIAFVYVAVQVFIGQGKRGRLIFFAVCLALLGLILVAWQFIARYTIDLVIDKLGSESFEKRNASNANSWSVMLDSFGLGVGLGSDRPSSLFFLLLSSVGVIGIILFLRGIGGYALVGMRDPGRQPLVWAFLAQVIAMLVAKPDISAPAFWLILGLLGVGYNEFARERRNSRDQPWRARDAIGSLVSFIPDEIRSLRAPTASPTGEYTLGSR
ncbi:hypothetical protein [Microbacterium sp. JZ37]|uniref:hypothetical protein n=1 Tax=Microbacterium sp. JZ37 TaxID=2654193 RepID=UPI002B4A65F2|nr:hypothetical protein [Microbacterium sp. JZ37]WRH18257.1 hypothetical protein GC092_12535 [Microbacterium sp. JZ37]